LIMFDVEVNFFCHESPLGVATEDLVEGVLGAVAEVTFFRSMPHVDRADELTELDNCFMDFSALCVVSAKESDVPSSNMLPIVKGADVRTLFAFPLLLSTARAAALDRISGGARSFLDETPVEEICRFRCERSPEAVAVLSGPDRKPIVSASSLRVRRYSAIARIPPFKTDTNGNPISKSVCATQTAIPSRDALLVFS